MAAAAHEAAEGSRLARQGDSAGNRGTNSVAAVDAALLDDVER